MKTATGGTFCVFLAYFCVKIFAYMEYFIYICNVVRRVMSNPYIVVGSRVKRKVRLIAVTDDPIEVLNRRTGEVKTATPFVGNRTYTDKSEFAKVYDVGSMMRMGGCALKVFLYGVYKMGYDGKFVLEIDECAGLCGISHRSVSRGLRDLIGMDAVRKDKKGVYWINPNIAYRGNRDELLDENNIV